MSHLASQATAMPAEFHDHASGGGAKGAVAGLSWLDTAFPWSVSVMFHTGLGLLLLFLLFVTASAHRGETDFEPIIIPTAPGDRDPADPGHRQPSGFGRDLTRLAAQDRIKLLNAQGYADSAAARSNPMAFLAGRDGGQAAIECIYSGTGAAQAGPGIGGLGGGGPLAPFGTAGGGNPSGIFQPGKDPASRNALKVVYILDRSGGMVPTFQSLRREVERSVGGLSLVQSFAVVMCGTYGDLTRRTDYHPAFIVGGANTLLKATKDAKAKVFADLAKVSVGEGNDDALQPFEESFKIAFALKPELIYFLTDGAFDPKLVAIVKDLNAKGGNRVHVNTIAYGGSKQDDGAEQTRYREQLQQISQDNGGVFRHVTDDELGWEAR